MHPSLPNDTLQSIIYYADNSTSSFDPKIKLTLSMLPATEKAYPAALHDPWSFTGVTAPLSVQSISSRIIY